MISLLDYIRSFQNLPEMVADAGVYLSQGGEDIVINSLLSGEIERGIYLDIGAYHPIRYSNTMLLYLKGWRGINVDGNSETIDLFKKYRPDDVSLNLLVSDKEEQIEFFRFQEGAYNTTNAAAARELIARGKPEYTLVEHRVAHTTPIGEILERHVGEKKFDLLTIDVEGLDLRIFRAIDFSRFRPRLICIEAPIQEWMGESMSGYLRAIGYKPIAQCVHSAIFMREDR